MTQIAIISGKGGTGKSSITAAFATLDGQVVVADCDVDAANLYLLFKPDIEEEEAFTSGHKAVINNDLCTVCGFCIDKCRFDAISLEDKIVTIDEISCEGCFLCARICPENAISMIPDNGSRLYSGTFRNGWMVYGRLAPGEENTGKLVNSVREKAKQISAKHNIDVIVLDGPPGIGCPVISTVTGVDKVIIVTEPTISGLLDFERAAEIVLKSGHKPIVIINKWDLNPLMTNQIRDLCLQKNITIAGLLPFDSIVVEAMVREKTITEFESENEISTELRRIWNYILNNN